MMPSVLGQRYGDGGITTTQLAADGECQAIRVYDGPGGMPFSCRLKRDYFFISSILKRRYMSHTRVCHSRKYLWHTRV